MIVLSTRRGLGAVVGSDFSDPTNERLIYLSAAGLVVVGVALLVGTILWWRRGRQEHPALAPLEVLGSRSWTKASEGDRRRRLDRVRVGGVVEPVDEPIHSEPVDLRELLRSMPQAFDDLRDPEPEPEPPAEVEPGEVAAIEAAVEAAVADGAAEPPVMEAAAAPAPVAEVAAPAVVVDPDATSFSAERPVEHVMDESASVPGGNS